MTKELLPALTRSQSHAMGVLSKISYPGGPTTRTPCVRGPRRRLCIAILRMPSLAIVRGDPDGGGLLDLSEPDLKEEFVCRSSEASTYMAASALRDDFESESESTAKASGALFAEDA